MGDRDRLIRELADEANRLRRKRGMKFWDAINEAISNLLPDLNLEERRELGAAIQKELTQRSALKRGARAAKKKTVRKTQSQQMAPPIVRGKEEGHQQLTFGSIR